MIDDDLADFFDTDDFGVSVTRSRLLASDVTFTAIIGLSDEDALGGRVIAAQRELAWVTGPDVVEGDTLTIATGTHAGTYTVREPRRVNDGAESRAFLQQVSA